MIVYLVDINYGDDYETKVFSTYSSAINWLYNEEFELDVNTTIEEEMGKNFYKEVDFGHYKLDVTAEIIEKEIEDDFNNKYKEKKYENEGKFETICLVCGSNNVSCEQEYDYDYEENMYPTGNSYLYCNDCGNCNQYY